MQKPKRRWLKILLIVFGVLLALLAGLVALAMIYGDNLSSPGSGWTVKNGDGQTLYAVVAPTKTNLNLKAVVLACEFVNGSRALHLQLYPVKPGLLLPSGSTAQQMKDNPSIRLEIDGAAMAARLDFAGDFAVVSNQVANNLPTMTRALGDALERGRQLTLRFDLVRDTQGSQPYDSYAIVDLKATNGANAIGAVRRRCGQ